MISRFEILSGTDERNTPQSMSATEFTHWLLELLWLTDLNPHNTLSNMDSETQHFRHIWLFYIMEKIKMLFKQEDNYPSVPKMVCKISIRQFWFWWCISFWKASWKWRRHNKDIYWCKLANKNSWDNLD